MRFKIYLLIFPVLFQFCSSTVTTDELKKYIQDPKNGLKKEVQLNDDKISLMYIPANLLISSEIRNKENLKQEIIDSLSQLYNDRTFFQIGFSYKENDFLQKHILDKNKRSDIISYFSYDITNDIKITTKADTINCISCIYIPVYELSKSNNILLVFKKEDIKELKEFNIKFNGYKLGFKNVSFHFKQKDINKIPEVNFFLK